MNRREFILGTAVVCSMPLAAHASIATDDTVIAGNWIINYTTKTIGINSSRPPEMTTVLELHRALQDAEDEVMMTGDDLSMDILLNQSVSQRATDQIITFPEYELEEEAAMFLYGGSITTPKQDWAGLAILGRPTRDIENPDRNNYDLVLNTPELVDAKPYIYGVDKIEEMSVEYWPLIKIDPNNMDIKITTSCGTGQVTFAEYGYKDKAPAGLVYFARPNYKSMMCELIERQANQPLML